MSHSSSRKLRLVLAYGFAAMPVGFGALRLLTTGDDVRYLAMALASLLAAATVFRIGAQRILARWLLSTVALAVSTLLGGAVAVWQGANSASAVWFVTLSFSLCVTLGGMLGAYSRDAV